MPNERNSSKVRFKTINRKRLIALAGATIVLISGVAIGKTMVKNKAVSLPQDKIMTTVSMEVERGDELETIAGEYYTDDYEGVYSSLRDYEKAIMENNDIKYPDNIDAGDELNIPVIVDSDSPYLAQITTIKNKIAEIENNNFWVEYTVQYGDRIENLAERASGSYEEMYEYSNLISSKNKIGSILRAGETIWIINPELGELKSELVEVEEQLKQSLTGTQAKK